jgi:hypothetical protein
VSPTHFPLDRLDRERHLRAEVFVSGELVGAKEGAMLADLNIPVDGI